MKISNRQYALALYELTKDTKAEKLSEALQAFANLLAKDRKLKQADNIILEFIKISKSEEGIVELHITSARKLDEKVLEAIKKAFGKKTETVENIDKSLIGGVKVRLEDKIFDASLKTQLRVLKEQLI